MRSVSFIIAALQLAAVPAAASPVLQQPDTAQAEQPVGENWRERWQGRHHWLYDDIAKDAATDGHAANARATCRSVPVRVKRSDGTTTVRRVNRCE